ncbi:DUF4158 domain-containing protein [Siculibacillus lacustris]|uniref:DUF4158 domain-containing protein n=1 Tax=Siculibacillus lacustris TaxID=1549641 RepID=A0A4Q9VDF6_9HYPH|nr:DUF4158 domain-containing protein [Siculibacillus lacustris]
MRRQRLSEAQIKELFDPPSDPRELVRHFTLSTADLEAVRRNRGDHNRLGLALMRCYLRHRVVRLSGTGKCRKGDCFFSKVPFGIRLA